MAFPFFFVRGAAPFFFFYPPHGVRPLGVGKKVGGFLFGVGVGGGGGLWWFWWGGGGWFGGGGGWGFWVGLVWVGGGGWCFCFCVGGGWGGGFLVLGGRRGPFFRGHGGSFLFFSSNGHLFFGPAHYPEFLQGKIPTSAWAPGRFFPPHLFFFRGLPFFGPLSPPQGADRSAVVCSFNSARNLSFSLRAGIFFFSRFPKADRSLPPPFFCRTSPEHALANRRPPPPRSLIGVHLDLSSPEHVSL